MIVVPLYDMIILPDANILLTSEQIKRFSSDSGVALNEKIILIVAKSEDDIVSLSQDGFYPIGISASVADINHKGYVNLRMEYRVNIENIIFKDGKIDDLVISRRNDIDDLPLEREREKLSELKKEMLKFSSGYEFADAARVMIEQLDTLTSAVCLVSYFLNITSEEKYSLLAEDSKMKRASLIEKFLYEFMEVGRITNEALTSQQQEYQQRYKEAAIKKQIEYLQKELDEMHPENVTDIQKFKQRIENSGMNETARVEAEKVLNRLRQDGKESPESGMLYDYLDFVTTLSWKKESVERINLSDARKILDEEHYGLKAVKDRIIQQIAVMNLKNQQSGSILLFVGAPGCGKTSIGKSIAKALGRKYVRVSLGGMHDEADIRGHRRTYIGAMPGRIMDGIHKSGVTNPVMVLDEVDKLSSSYNGSPSSALLEVLDPEQNNTFTDHYMNVPYDLSDVLFVCTANTLDTIPEPLLDRMEIIQFQGYTPIEKFRIAKDHLLPKSMESMGIDSDKISVSDSVLNLIISDYTMEAGVRELRKCIDNMCRSLAVKIEENNDLKKIDVDDDMIRDILDIRPIRHDKILPYPKAGVVTGLAWTRSGGDILYIETTFMSGKGEVIITGQLGDVMKESARIAISLVKKIFPIESEKLHGKDLHIHVPLGSVPKDGPSAGITLTLALSSLITDKIIDPHIAMTGEVALRGAVMPIGGLAEKLMAAQRAGVTKVLIPEENLYDLKDVADDVKNKINIITISTVEDALRAVGIIKGNFY